MKQLSTEEIRWKDIAMHSPGIPVSAARAQRIKVRETVDSLCAPESVGSIIDGAYRESKSFVRKS